MATMAFDANYYLAQYQDVREAVTAGKITAEQHWKLYGCKEERNPNAEFNTSYYAAHNTDVVASGMNYLDHYIKYGSAEAVAGKRLPNSSWESIDLTKFDKAAYLSSNPDVKASGMDALQHYMLYGRFEASRAGTAKLTDGTVVTTPAVTTPGETFTLTANVDTLSPNSAVAAFKTTIGDDLIRGVATGDLGTVDSIDAGAGNDTLTANISGAGAIAPILANIENVKLTTDTAPAAITPGTGAVTTTSINLASATGISTLTLAADGVNHAAATNITLGTKLVADDGPTAGVGNIAFAFKAASVTGAADSADLTVQGKADGGVIYVNSIENITLHSAAKAGVTAANNINLLADSATTLTIDGGKALTLATSAATEANLTGIDASAMTAGLTYGNTGALAAANSFSIKTGAGADTLNLVGAANKLVVDTGAGNDTVSLTTTAATKGSAITTGTGVDTIAITATAANFAATDLTTAAKLDAAAIKVTDFVKGSDVLSVKGAVGTTFLALTGPQLAAIADTSVNTDLLAAVNAAAAIAGNNQAVVFAYGTNTYLYVEDATAGLSAGDTLIKVVGVTDTLTNNVNFTIA